MELSEVLEREGEGTKEGEGTGEGEEEGEGREGEGGREELQEPGNSIPFPTRQAVPKFLLPPDPEMAAITGFVMRPTQAPISPCTVSLVIKLQHLHLPT